MHPPWIGPRRFAVVPAAVNPPVANDNLGSFDPAPPDWADRIRERLFYDREPASGVDRSVRAYFHAVSYGRALLEADVFNPVTVQRSHCGAMQDEAIATLPAGHTFEYACVVFPGGSHPCTGWAFYDYPLFPGTIRLRNWCYVSMGPYLGVWAHEMMHAATGFGDLYKTTPHPGNFDNMACSCGTHPSTYTKLTVGWLDPVWIATAPSSATSTFTLHALALLQSPPPGRVTAVRIPGRTSHRYFIVEARLRTDPYESGTQEVSAGIPSEGVVIYEIDEAAWPIQLRTATALPIGQTYANPPEQLEVEVTASVPGGFAVEIRSTGEHPQCATARAEITRLQAEIDLLQDQLPTGDVRRDATLRAQILRYQAQVRVEQQRLIHLGCRPS